MSAKRLLIYGSAALFLIAAVIGINRARLTALVGAGFYAKMLCSGVFVSGRPPQEVINSDVLADQPAILSGYSSTLNKAAGTVKVSLAGLVSQTAVYREGLGCSLAIGKSADELRAVAIDLTPFRRPADSPRPWPEGEGVDTAHLPDSIDTAALDAAMARAFAEPNPSALKHTRAVVVVYRGRIVAERYAKGFGPHTPQLGWSMSKSVVNALVGALVAQGQLSTARQALLPEWRGPDDERGRISLDQLLRMSSGLEFSEAYGEQLSDVRVMLFLRGDKARYAANKPLVCAPGKCWSYSSGTTNIISRILRGEADASDTAYLTMPHRLLFGPLGMTTAVFEPDAAGTLVGSSYVYASARDWARLGLLYLQDGVWQGRRILPEGWLDYSLKPTPGSGGEYGAHIWLTLPTPPSNGVAAAESRAPIPHDAFYFLGHDGQMVAVIPSRETVIVRLGLSRKPGAFDHAELISSILAALP